jgi:hypothetical protein
MWSSNAYGPPTAARSHAYFTFMPAIRGARTAEPIGTGGNRVRRSRARPRAWGRGGQGAGVTRGQRPGPEFAARYALLGSGGSGEPVTIAIGLVGSGDPMTEAGSGGSGEGCRMGRMTSS